jgi:hypothetical protein
VTEPPPDTHPTPPAEPGPSAQTPETDWKAEARKWEQRAKENFGRLQEVQPLADQFRQLEEASKTEAQRMQEAIEAANRSRDETAAEALRMRVAMSHGLTAEDIALLGVGTEDQLTANAQRLAQLKSAAQAAQQQATPPPAAHTVADLRPGATPGEPPATGSVEARHRQFFAARYPQANN